MDPEGDNESCVIDNGDGELDINSDQDVEDMLLPDQRSEMEDITVSGYSGHRSIVPPLSDDEQSVDRAASALAANVFATSMELSGDKSAQGSNCPEEECSPELQSTKEQRDELLMKFMFRPEWVENRRKIDDNFPNLRDISVSSCLPNIKGGLLIRSARVFGVHISDVHDVLINCLGITTIIDMRDDNINPMKEEVESRLIISKFYRPHSITMERNAIITKRRLHHGTSDGIVESDHTLNRDRDRDSASPTTALRPNLRLLGQQAFSTINNVRNALQTKPVDIHRRPGSSPPYRSCSGSEAGDTNSDSRMNTGEDRFDTPQDSSATHADRGDPRPASDQKIDSELYKFRVSEMREDDNASRSSIRSAATDTYISLRVSKLKECLKKHAIPHAVAVDMVTNVETIPVYDMLTKGTPRCLAIVNVLDSPEVKKRVIQHATSSPFLPLVVLAKAADKITGSNIAPFYFCKFIVSAHDIVQSYYEMVDNCGVNFATCLKIIAASDGPVMYHCSLGKDRTGILSLLILDILGASEQAIIFDYTLTAEANSRYRQYVRRFCMEYSGLSEPFCGAEAEVMRLTINYIKDNYGSLQGYQDAIGFDANWRSYMRSKYLWDQNLSS